MTGECIKNSGAWGTTSPSCGCRGPLSPIDFNGHGKSDRRATAIWLMNGGAIASTPGLGNVATPWAIAGVGDFDGDGEADLL